jgi:hypothetical protein
MRLDRRSQILPLFVAAALLACSLLPAGSNPGGDMTVSSSDGVASITYAPGSVEGDPEIQITAADLAAEWDEFSDSLLAYDMQPSGLQFDEPAKIRFELDLEVDPEAVPLSLIVVQDDSGLAEALETHVSREGSKVVISADIPHFSRTYVWLGAGLAALYYRIEPSTLQMDVGTSSQVDVIALAPRPDGTLYKLNEDYVLDFMVNSTPAGSDYISVVGDTYVQCDHATGGVINQAFDVDLVSKSGIPSGAAQVGDAFSKWTTGLSIDTSNVTVKGTMSGNVECVDAGPLPTPTDQRPPEETTLETPPVLTGFETSVEEPDTADCDFKPPSGDGEAILHGGDDGFVLSLYKPFGLSILGDGNGELTWTYAAGPVGVGETNPRQVEVLSLERTAETLTLRIQETRFTDDFPDGCSRTYNVVYQLEDQTVLDFLELVPYAGSQGTKVENPNLMKGDGFFTLEGQFVNMSPGQEYHLWTQVSAADETYDLTPISPAADGTFSVTVVINVSTGDWTVIEALVDGVSVASTSGGW